MIIASFTCASSYGGILTHERCYGAALHFFTSLSTSMDLSVAAIVIRDASAARLACYSLAKAIKARLGFVGVAVATTMQCKAEEDARNNSNQAFACHLVGPRVDLIFKQFN